MEKAGYETLLKAITPDDKSPQVSWQLLPERQPRGTLWIDANRASSVFLDGNDTGMVTPTIGIRVAPGPHRVELRDASGEKGPSAQVHLNQGETRHLDIGLRQEKTKTRAIACSLCGRRPRRGSHLIKLATVAPAGSPWARELTNFTHQVESTTHKRYASSCTSTPSPTSWS